MRPSVAQIARAAGVSTATVDRVLNNRESVHGRTREHVLHVLRNLEGVRDLAWRSAGAAPPKSFDIIMPPGNSGQRDLMVSEVEALRPRLAQRGVILRPHPIRDFTPSALAETILAAARRSDGVCVPAMDHPLVRGAIDAAVAGGTPVVTLWSDVPRSRRLAHVGADGHAAGRLAGYLLGRFLGGVEGEVAAIAGSLTYRSHAERELGLRAVLQEDFPNLRYVGAQESYDEHDRARDLAADLVARHPALVGVCQIGGPADAVAEGLATAQGRHIVLIGQGLNPTTRRLLLSGAVDAIISQDFRQEILNALELLADFHQGESAPQTEPSPISVYFRENVA